MKLIFERSVEGRGCSLLPECDVPVVMPSMERKSPLRLPRCRKTISAGIIRSWRMLPMG